MKKILAVINATYAVAKRKPEKHQGSNPGKPSTPILISLQYGQTGRKNLCVDPFFMLAPRAFSLHLVLSRRMKKKGQRLLWCPISFSVAAQLLRASDWWVKRH